MRADYWSILEPIIVDPARKSWKDVLRNLIFHANIEGCAWPSIATIRAETGYKSAKAIIDALAGLRSLGLIFQEEAENKKTGRGHVTKWMLSPALSTLVDKLEKQPNISERDTERNGEVSSRLSKKVKSLPIKGEATSQKGEVTSHGIYKEENKVSKSVSTRQKGEVTSHPVNNSQTPAASAEEVLAPHDPKRTEIAPSARKDAGEGTRGPAPMDVSKIFPEIQAIKKPIDYLALCSELGWKPNDSETVPDKAALEQARRAVVACAYREGLSTAEAKKFLRWNAGRKWSGVDRSSCVKDLAKLWLEKWQKDNWEAYCDERHRRSEAARLREEQKQRALVQAERKS